MTELVSALVAGNGAGAGGREWCRSRGTEPGSVGIGRDPVTELVPLLGNGGPVLVAAVVPRNGLGRAC
ncbi:MAG: hypothetical protein JW751_12015 [Polyangiaceae bacterium]|nr:hypothetical protein [Polyangiaceae bacterium]